MKVVSLQKLFYIINQIKYTVCTARATAHIQYPLATATVFIQYPLATAPVCFQ